MKFIAIIILCSAIKAENIFIVKATELETTVNSSLLESSDDKPKNINNVKTCELFDGSSNITKKEKRGECCEGYERLNGHCEPICKEVCRNSNCTAPDTCTCIDGFVKFTKYRCLPKCDDHCTHTGTCIAPNKCKCLSDYELNVNTNKCEPKCNGCKNGNCTAPDKCECFLGYEFKNNSLNECVPICNLNNINEDLCKPKCNTNCKNGKCVKENVCQCFEGFDFVNGSENECQPICHPMCENGQCVSPNDCRCNEGYVKNRNTCKPECREVWINGFCDKPNELKCLPGYQYLRNNFCQPVCDPECINGTCDNPNKCKCFVGYEPITNTSNKCQPICEPKCLNGECVAPNKCECLFGYELSLNVSSNNTVINTNQCNKICHPKCIFGECINGECQCNSGYTLQMNSSFECVPKCESGCHNGTCIAPGICECDIGYEKHNETICTKLCSPKCEYAKCVNGECKCFDGYELDVTNVHKCKPKCEPNCINAVCRKPGECECHMGYTHLSSNICFKNCTPTCDLDSSICNQHGICECLQGYSRLLNDSTLNQCEPICNTSCPINSECSAPDKCECLQGYVNNNNECKPDCSGLIHRCQNGICVQPNICECLPGYEKNIINNNQCEQLCTQKCGDYSECQNGECVCISGYKWSIEEKICQPQCTPACINSDCVKPDICQCWLGFENQNTLITPNECRPKCTPACINSDCVEPHSCQCWRGFEFQNTLDKPFECKPICYPECKYSNCVEPNICQCWDGYENAKNNASNECTPECLPKCLHGDCVQGQCQCKEGYDRSDEQFQCQPDCDNCENGKCEKPNECLCNLGYEFNKEFNNCIKLCTPKCGDYGDCHNGECICVSGYEWSIEKNMCKPKCYPECKNSNCIKTNMCECWLGYENINNECSPICSPKCLHGICVEGKCQCKDGYNRSDEKFQCQPDCDDCKNGKCEKPNECQCNAGYEFNKEYKDCIKLCNGRLCIEGECFKNSECKCKHNDELIEFVNYDKCYPKCNITCRNGYCTDDDKCNCLSGYKKQFNHIQSDYTCEPICDKQYCDTNSSYCKKPNECKCLNGYAYNGITGYNDTINQNFTNIFKCQPKCKNDCGFNGLCIAPNVCEVRDKSLTDNIEEKHSHMASWRHHHLTYLLPTAVLLLIFLLAVITFLICLRKYRDAKRMYNIQSAEARFGIPYYVNKEAQAYA